MNGRVQRVCRSIERWIDRLNESGLSQWDKWRMDKLSGLALVNQVFPWCPVDMKGTVKRTELSSCDKLSGSFYLTCWLRTACWNQTKWRKGSVKSCVRQPSSVLLQWSKEGDVFVCQNKPSTKHPVGGLWPLGRPLGPMSRQATGLSVKP